MAVENNYPEVLVNIAGTEYLTGPQGARGPQGETGPQGPQGPQGDAGEGAYTNWLELGNVGTPEDFLKTLKSDVEGPQGPQGLQGPEGPVGPQGPQGDEGPQGPRGEAGPAGMEWRGVWDADIDYINDDAVAHNGSSWFAAGDPPHGEEPTMDSDYWNPLATQGAAGPEGKAGPRGDQGPQGIEGPQGPQGLQGPTGDQGPQGPEGTQGPEGPQGDTGNAGVLVLNADDSIPAGTPDGVIIFRRVTL